MHEREIVGATNVLLLCEINNLYSLSDTESIPEYCKWVTSVFLFLDFFFKGKSRMNTFYCPNFSIAVKAIRAFIAINSRCWIIRNLTSLLSRQIKYTFTHFCMYVSLKETYRTTKVKGQWKLSVCVRVLYFSVTSFYPCVGEYVHIFACVISFLIYYAHHTWPNHFTTSIFMSCRKKELC